MPASRSRRSLTFESASVTIRDALPADAVAIVDVQIRTWQHAYRHVFPAERLGAIGERREQRLRFWRGMIETPARDADTLVADRAGAVVGFASFGRAREYESLGELYAIYVLPEAWGSGAGRALMDEVLERLRASGLDEAVLWVLDDNPRARRFYERAGWSVDGPPRLGEHLETPVAEVRYRIALLPPR